VAGVLRGSRTNERLRKEGEGVCVVLEASVWKEGKGRGWGRGDAAVLYRRVEVGDGSTGWHHAVGEG
jgi:hypothetical protein